MWFWIGVGAGVWVLIGVALIIQGIRRFGSIADASTLLVCLLGGPITWWVTREERRRW